MSADCTKTVREYIQCSKNNIRLLKQKIAVRLFPEMIPLESVAIYILVPLPN